MSTAYIRSLMKSVEAEHAKRQAQREEQARAEAQAAREKLVPLDVRLKRLLGTIQHEVQADGISLETLREDASRRERARVPLRGHWRRASSNGLA